jgi:hypothetical protein
MMQSDVHLFSASDIEPLQRILGISARPSVRAAGTLVIIAGSVALLAYIGEGAMLAAAMAGVTLLIAGLAWATPAFSRRKLLQWIERHAGCAPTVRWDDAGFRTDGCRHNEEGTFDWRSVRAAIVSPNYLVMQTRLGPMIVPRRALDDARSRDLHGHFERNSIPVRIIGD